MEPGLWQSLHGCSLTTIIKITHYCHCFCEPFYLQQRGGWCKQFHFPNKLSWGRINRFCWITKIQQLVYIEVKGTVPGGSLTGFIPDDRAQQTAHNSEVLQGGRKKHASKSKHSWIFASVPGIWIAVVQEQLIGLIKTIVIGSCVVEALGLLNLNEIGRTSLLD